MNKRALVSWSGGKDSCFAAMQAITLGYEPVVLLNVLNEEGNISRSHGIPKEILQAQADAAILPVHLIAASWQAYEQHFTAALQQLKDQHNVKYAIFGDIDLEAHREWEEKVCSNAGLQAILPLWQQDRKELVLQMLLSGMETIIVSCNETMGSRFLGQQLTPHVIEEIEALDVDPCGENGEYHTLVTHCQLFQKPILVTITNKVKHGNYWFSDLTLME